MIPRYPNIGYRYPIRFENPICETGIDIIHIITKIVFFIFFSFVIFCNNPLPKDIAVVSIDANITIP